MEWWSLNGFWMEIFASHSTPWTHVCEEKQRTSSTSYGSVLCKSDEKLCVCVCWSALWYVSKCTFPEGEINDKQIGRESGFSNGGDRSVDVCFSQRKTTFHQKLSVKHFFFLEGLCFLFFSCQLPRQRQQPQLYMILDLKAVTIATEV